MIKKILLSTTLSVCAHAQDAFTLLPHPDKLLSPDITEASGLAVSPRSEDFFWVINDSGGSPEIHLCNTDGTPRGSVKIKGLKNKDWEDLSAFTYQGESYLLIADIGDNTAERDSVSLYIVREPAIPSTGKSVSGKIPIAWKIEFTYEEGARDCESVAVDPREEKIILISKRTKPPEVYELPLRPKKKHPVAKRIGKTLTIAPALSFLPHRNQPTGLDISSDGSSAVIVTYYGVFLFPKAKEKKWSEAFAAKPVRIGSHKLPQSESVAFSNDGKSIYCVSEGKNSSIAIFQAGVEGE
jgi:hypothetical protein|tara:strand:+ start:2121 stop:3011 length:891 start_codon:yes stop_codon:yes gene_type:complete